mmetsp:Transcript_71083/g.196817  ORF Transcript_71083/g.196817 Transcript_71083/m.196817 type:complete len:216 (-) Transcript_71083:111-758(-)
MMQQQSQAVRPAAFRELEEALAKELVQTLDTEHRNEIEYLWQEQQQLRQELTRIVSLMQKEIVPRERMMHDLLETMHKSYDMARNHLHQGLSDHMDKARDVHSNAASRRSELVNPMVDMEQELQRIARLLGHEAVAPDIQGWRPAGPGSPPMRPMTGGTGSPVGAWASPAGGSPLGAYAGSPSAGYGGSPSFRAAGASPPGRGLAGGGFGQGNLV